MKFLTKVREKNVGRTISTKSSVMCGISDTDGEVVEVNEVECVVKVTKILFEEFSITEIETVHSGEHRVEVH